MKKKSKITAGLLGIFLGTFGVHNFYIGSYGKATAQLLITVLSAGLLAFISLCWGVAEGILILTNCIDINQKYRKEHGTIEENKEFAKESFKKFNKTRSYAIDYVKKHTKLSVEEIKEVENEFDLENQELEKYKQESLKRQQENKNELLQKQGQPEISKQLINTKTEKISTSPTVTNYHYIELDGQLKSSFDILNEIKSQSSNIGFLILDRNTLIDYKTREMTDFKSIDEYNEYITEFERHADVVWEEMILTLESEGYYCEYKDIYPNKEDYKDYLKATYHSIFKNKKLYDEEEFKTAKQEKLEKEEKLRKQQKVEKLLKPLDSLENIVSGAADLGTSFVRDMNRWKYGDKVDDMSIYEIDMQNEKDKVIKDLNKNKK